MNILSAKNDTFCQQTVCPSLLAIPHLTVQFDRNVSSQSPQLCAISDSSVLPAVHRHPNTHTNTTSHSAFQGHICTDSLQYSLRNTKCSRNQCRRFGDGFQTIIRADQLLPYYVMDVAGSVPGLPGIFIAGVFCAALR